MPDIIIENNKINVDKKEAISMTSCKYAILIHHTWINAGPGFFGLHCECFRWLLASSNTQSLKASHLAILTTYLFVFNMMGRPSWIRSGVYIVL